MNIILTSEMRVGSRWLHYLLKDLLNLGVSGELDGSLIPDCQGTVERYFKQGKIVKFHHASTFDIFKLIGNYKVIGVVRNPRDRVVSYAFHQRYKPNPSQGLIELKQAPTDKEAVRLCLYHPLVLKHNIDQLELMEEGYSTRKFKQQDGCNQRYIWTTYHWLKTDLIGEMLTINKFLNANKTYNEIKNACNKHSFKRRSGRKVGIEERDNEWFRKGEEGDYILWFDKQMKEDSRKISKEYWTRLRNEENGTVS